MERAWLNLAESNHYCIVTDEYFFKRDARSEERVLKGLVSMQSWQRINSKARKVEGSYFNDTLHTT